MDIQVYLVSVQQTLKRTSLLVLFLDSQLFMGVIERLIMTSHTLLK